MMNNWVENYRIRNKNSWEWKTTIPMIGFIYVIASSYLWTNDMVVLMVPLTMALIWQLYENKKWISKLLNIYVTINIVYLRLHLVMEDSKFIGFAPALFAWYLIAYTFHTRQQITRTITEAV